MLSEVQLRVVPIDYSCRSWKGASEQVGPGLPVEMIAKDGIGREGVD